MKCKIFKDEVLVNIIESEPEFCKEFCKENGYTYVLEKPEPKTAEERIAELENALCDLDAANEEAHATYETALCDLDETLNGGSV